MELSQLEAFVETCKAGSFTRAADALYISQPALHRKVRQLEAELGTSLLVVRNRRVVPTAVGEKLLATARGVLAQLQALEGEIKGGTEVIHLGAVSLIASTIVPDAIRRFEACPQNPPVALHGMDADGLTDALLAGRVDLGVTYLNYVSPDLEYEPFCDVPTVCAVGRSHPLNDGRRHEIAELLHFPIALTEAGMGLRTSVEQTFRERLGIEKLPVSFEAKTGALLAQMAAASNLYVTFLPLTAVRHFGLEAVQLDVEFNASHMVLSHIKGVKPSPIVAALIEILKAQALQDPDVIR